MALLGQAAIALAFDVVHDAIVEHDDWHTHEHLPERLAIPGFLRGSRWTRVAGNAPRYFVLYEVRDLKVLTTGPYLERLNQPTPWTAKMMQYYRNMSRSICRVESSHGRGLGRAAMVVRHEKVDAPPGRDLAGLASQPGLAGAHLLASAAAAAMTSEQRIRGRDSADSRVEVVTGYDVDAVTRLYDTAPGGNGSTAAVYSLDYSLTDREAA